MASPKTEPLRAAESQPRARPLLKSSEAIQERFRELRARFRAAHAAGLAALRTSDYQALGAAMAASRAILEKQAALIEKLLISSQLLDMPHDAK